MFQFDENGNLMPYDLIQATLTEVEAVFVYNVRRQELFHELTRFLGDLKHLDIGKPDVWINGSFTTNKKYPKDIDVVVWIQHDDFPTIRDFQFTIEVKYQGKLDLFFEPVFPESHPNYRATLESISYWSGLYGYDVKGYQKGIIKLSF